MSMKPTKYYYALVWGTALKEKSFVVKGSLLTKKTRLPKDPKILYGTSPKDIRKILVSEYKNVISYNVFTGKQSVRFEKVSEEYTLKRDVLVVIWEDYEEIDLAWNYHRVVAPDFLEVLAKESMYESDCEEISWEEIINPEFALKNNIKELLGMTRELEYSV